MSGDSHGESRRGNNGRGGITSHLSLIAFFATVLSLAVGASMWIGALQADVYAAMRWIEGKNNENLPGRLATLETKVELLRERVNEIEDELRSFDVRGSERYQEYLRKRESHPGER